jgi:hypothetical protein
MANALKPAKSIDPSVRAKAKELAAAGMTLRSIAAQLGVSQSTLSRWPEVASAARAAKDGAVPRCRRCGRTANPPHAAQVFIARKWRACVICGECLRMYPGSLLYRLVEEPKAL